MVQRTVVAVLCDVCGRDDAAPYRIGFGVRGAPRKFDLCREDAAPLYAIREAADSAQARDGRRRQVKVAAKPVTAAKRTPAKKKTRSSN